MKKISIILVASLLIGATFTSCEEGYFDDVYDNDNNNSNNNNSNNDTPGAIENFSVQLAYNSESISALSAFDAETCSAVAYKNSAADVALCWQNGYGYVITQPSGYLIKELYSANNISASNSNVTTIQNLGKVNISNYADKKTLSQLSVSSGTIPNLNGKNQVMVESGDVIAFKTNQGTVGVGKISNLSKVKKNVKFEGYVYYSSSSSK